MHALEYRVLSIGTLSANPLWDEREPARTGHATTVLIRSGKSTIVVDPGLPPAALGARFAERTNIALDEVTHVFLTAFTPEHTRGLHLFERASWLVHAPEREAAEDLLSRLRAEARRSREQALLEHLEHELHHLSRCADADDRLAPGVDLFPLPGVTPGTCGLLLSLPALTVLVTGDAVASEDHLARGQVLPHSQDLTKAQESFREAIEIADLLIPGRGNVSVNPLRGGSARAAGVRRGSAAPDED